MKKIGINGLWYLLLLLLFLISLLLLDKQMWEYRKNSYLEFFRQKEESLFQRRAKYRDSILRICKPFPVWDTVSVEEPLTERVLLRFYNAETIHVMVIQDTSRVVFSDSVGSRLPKPESISLVRGHEALVVINRVLSVNIPIRDIHAADLYYDGWLNRVSVVNCKSGK